MKILFVDHIFHEKTRSSEFFRTLLARSFELRTLYVDPDEPSRLLDSIEDAQEDLAVLWQMDYLAPIFLAMGMRVIVIPMYDGSANMPDVHWLWARQARFINFSRRLHAKIGRCGGDSLLVKYFKPPVRENRLKKFDKLNVLLWQRRPEHGINLNMVERLLGTQIDSLHVHDTPDDEKCISSAYMLRSMSGYELTTSSWFKSPDDYARLLDRCNVFIAPRRTEGIGMAFLEAMSRGFLVFAADGATHDEYLANWVNGVLFNPDQAGYTDLHDRAEAMGRMAWKTAQIGYEKWLASQADLLDFIRTTPKPVFAKRPDAADFARSLIAHYSAGLEQYRAFLLSNLQYLEAFGGSEAIERLEADGSICPQRRRREKSATEQYLEQLSSMPWLDQNRFEPSTRESLRHIVEGVVNVEDDCAWVTGDGLTLGFSLDPTLGATSKMQIAYKSLGSATHAAQYLVILNGWSIGSGAFAETEGAVAHDVPVHSLKRNNTLRIQILPGADASAASARESWGIARVEFV
ncbi:glycosyltransferase [Cupriavidus sp. PET2-C1]